MIKPVSRNTKFLVTRNIFLRSTVRFSYCMKFSMILNERTRMSTLITWLLKILFLFLSYLNSGWSLSRSRFFFHGSGFTTLGKRMLKIKMTCYRPCGLTGALSPAPGSGCPMWWCTGSQASPSYRHPPTTATTHSCYPEQCCGAGNRNRSRSKLDRLPKTDPEQ